ncbi:MAG: rod shape-determining protein MreD [Betaproteobacteria bacterium]|nr:rod shape-determining protein MreD [Betaproteobacteria bacterium]
MNGLSDKPLLPQGAELAAPPTLLKVYGSLTLALAMNLLPWPDDALWLAPDFTLMLLLYWHIHAPRYAGLGTAFFFGLITDVARGVLLGLDTLAYCTAAFFVLSLRLRLVNFDAPRQALQIAPILLTKEALVLGLGLALGRAADADWRWLASGVVAALLWAPLAMLVDRLTGRPSYPIQNRL